MRKIEDIVIPGLWKHYKGDIYEVTNIATDTKDGSTVVIYRKGRDYYTRPIEEWMDLIGDQYRFTKINNE